MRFDFDSRTFVEREKEGEKLAVIGEDRELTWLEFETAVEKLCFEIKEHGYDKISGPVMIYGHKSANMLVAMYAMMTLRIPYIPADIIYPFERVLKILEVSDCPLIINTTAEPLNIGQVDELHSAELNWKLHRKPKKNIEGKAKAENLVYIIFTSGSTGEPKGVQINDEAVRTFVSWMTSDFGFTTEEVFVNTAILSFDLSVFEVMTFGALGATLLLNGNKSHADADILLDRINRYQGTVWVSTPSFALVYSRMSGEKRMDSILHFLFCGEILPHGLAADLLKNYPHARVLNTYGPTEATVATTLVEIDDTILKNYKSLPVGRPMKFSELVIENGEIIITGPNVSVGYLNAPELNSRKFFTKNGIRAFRTGDGGYFEGDMLFFQGRNDDLVKLHGYRIELNEITSAILKLDYIAHADTIALKRNDQVKKIVSLVQLKENRDADVSGATISSELSRTLPTYMIPSDIKIVEEIPLNQNGKTDKKLLTELYMKLK